KYDVLMIADEVAVGFGRTGAMFACEHESVEPDLMCVAKGITGGYLPLAATFATQAIFDAFLGEPWEGRTLFHGHTYTGNPLACAAAIASLDLFPILALPEKIRALTDALEHLDVKERRQHGMMAGAVLHNPKNELRLGHRVAMAARNHGAIVRPLGDVLVLMPPLAMSPDEI